MSQVRRIDEQAQAAEHPSTDDPSPAGAPPPARRRALRGLLLVVVPGLILAGALWAYLHSGRYVSTENAYVKAHIVYVAPEVSGTVAALLVTENQHVTQGQLLFRLRQEPFRIALARARARLADVASQIEADRIGYHRAQSQIHLNQAAADYAAVQLRRQLGLRRSNLGTQQDLDATRYALDAANRQLEVSRQEAARLLARLNGDAGLAVSEHPRYRAAEAELQQAALDLEWSAIRSPVSGVVGRRPEAGAYVRAGAPSIAIVSDAEVWIEANFKETQLTDIQPGQPTEIRVDAYPGRVWQGHVESIAGASGAEFALLPPQNATGNWIKVVQRIPLRVAVDGPDDGPSLRVGMSTTVTVDTGHQRSWRELLPW